MTINIYELTWIDPKIDTTFAVCPNCHSEMMQFGEEWRCDECWNAFDDTGRRLRAISFSGITMRCPECGDRRIARDPHTDQRYCKACRTTFFYMETEAIHDAEGQIVGSKVKDFGEPDYPQNCPNCHEPLRVQIFDLPSGSTGKGFTCHHCDLTYRTDKNGLLIPFPECPRCGRKSLVRYGDIRKCKFCGLRTDLENQYIDSADAPRDNGEKSEVHTTFTTNSFQA